MAVWYIVLITIERKTTLCAVTLMLSPHGLTCIIRKKKLPQIQHFVQTLWINPVKLSTCFFFEMPPVFLHYSSDVVKACELQSRSISAYTSTSSQCMMLTERKATQKLARWHLLFLFQCAMRRSGSISFFIHRAADTCVLYKRYSTKLSDVASERGKVLFILSIPVLDGCVIPCIVIYQHNNTPQRIIYSTFTYK